MNGQALVDLAVAKVIPITDAEQAANVNSAMVLALVNEAYHTVERTAPWKWSEGEATLSLVAGQKDYITLTDVDTDVAVIQHIYDPVQHHMLHFLDERQRVHDYGTGTGIPESYSLWNGRLRVFPTPSVSRDLTVRYYSRWADLTVATEPVFPSTYHDMLADYAAAHLALRLPPTGDRFLPGSRAEPHRAAFDTKLASMLNDPRAEITADEVVNHDWYEYVTYSQDW